MKGESLGVGGYGAEKRRGNEQGGKERRNGERKKRETWGERGRGSTESKGKDGEEE